MDEVWKDVIGYEGYYQVSNIGRVRALDRIIVRSNGTLQTIKGKMKSLLVSYSGYSAVELMKNNKRTKYLVHRLVAEAFIPNPYNKPQIDHINTIRTDNRVENLHWVTASENMLNPISRNKWNESTANMSEECRQHIRDGQRKKKGKNNKKSKAVSQYTKDGEYIREWESMYWASQELHISTGKISLCARGKRMTAGGFKWQFTNQ